MNEYTDNSHPQPGSSPGQNSPPDAESSNMAESPTQPLQVRPSLGTVDRYELLERLGHGAFGAVYRARDTVAEIDVALKTLPPLVSHNPEEFENVKQNFQLVARLSHTNIAAMRHLHLAENVDSSAADGLSIGEGDYVVVMEYVAGRPLSDWRKDFADRKVPVEKAQEICRQIAAGLDHAHRQRIIHRDIKPWNVMIVPFDDEDSFICKILDFGLAAEVRMSMSRVSSSEGNGTGTRPYMAPEQWTGGKQGPAVDQYALAVMYYELISGDVPFASAFDSNDLQLMANVVKNEMPPPLAELSKRQNDILLTALRKKPENRFSSCGEFVAALQEVQQGHPIVQKTRDLMPGGRFMRSRVVPAIAGLIGFILLGFVCWYGWNAYQKYNTRVQLEQAVQQALAAKEAADWEKVRSIARAHLPVQPKVEEDVAEPARRLQSLRETAVRKRARISSLLDKTKRKLAVEEYATAWKTVKGALEIEPNNEHAIQLRERIEDAAGLAETTPLKSKAEMKWRSIQDVDPDQGVGEHLNKLEDMLSAANTLFEKEIYAPAMEKYQTVIAYCKALQTLHSARIKADAARERAEEARRKAENAQASDYFPELWNGGEKLKNSAQETYKEGLAEERSLTSAADGENVFTKAEKLWKSAAQQFRKAERYAEEKQNMDEAKEAYRTALTGISTPGLSVSKPELFLQKYGGAAWSSVVLKLENAKALVQDEKWKDAASRYREAREKLPAAVKEAKENWRQSEYQRCMEKGAEALKNENWQKARIAFNEALDVTGYGDPQGAQKKLREISLRKNLAEVREAKQRGNWSKVKKCSENVLPVTGYGSENRLQLRREFRNLLQKAEKHLYPWIKVVAVANGREIEGAEIAVDGEKRNHVTPATFKLEKGENHRISVKAGGKDGTYYKPFSVSWTSDYTGVRELKAELTKISGPVEGKDWTLNLGKEQQIVFKWIPAGEFMLGSRAEQRAWARGPKGQGSAKQFEDEGVSPRRCRMTNGFWLGRTEVTVGQWKEFVEDTGYKTDAEKQSEAWCYDSDKEKWAYVEDKDWEDPNWHGVNVRPEHPVACISWNDAMAFCDWLTRKERKAGRLPENMEYRLPGEAEWEYACRGGRTDASKFWWGDSLRDGQGRLNGASKDKLGGLVNKTMWKNRYSWSDGYAWAAPVDSYGSEGRNGFGLADMLGNVWEWCYDWYDNTGAASEINLEKGTYRVLRGGSYYTKPAYLRCAVRVKAIPSFPNAYAGFRVCLGPAVSSP